jgi:hypothetical protein
MLVSTYESTRRHSSEKRHSHGRENLKSYNPRLVRKEMEIFKQSQVIKQS